MICEEKWILSGLTYVIGHSCYAYLLKSPQFGEDLKSAK